MPAIWSGLAGLELVAGTGAGKKAGLEKRLKKKNWTGYVEDSA